MIYKQSNQTGLSRPVFHLFAAFANSFQNILFLLCYNVSTMKKVILQYLASALTVILILGLVVSNRQRNQSLVKKVKDLRFPIFIGFFGKSRQTALSHCWG